MKKKSLLILIFCCACFRIVAQETYLFKPYSFVNAHVGVGYSYNEKNSADNLSLHLAAYYGYRFHKVLGVRLGVSGFQNCSSAYITSPSTAKGVYQPYQCNYLQGNADLMVDLASLFSGYNPFRKFTPYIFAGVGGNYAFGNDNATSLNGMGASLDTWSSMVSIAGRAGLGFNQRLGKYVCLNIELDANLLNDGVNAKTDGSPDLQFCGAAGLTFYFGKGGTGIKEKKHDSKGKRHKARKRNQGYFQDL